MTATLYTARVVPVVLTLAIGIACSSGGPGQTAGQASTSTPGAATTAAPAAPAEPAKPKFREVTLPAATVLHATLETAVSSDKSKVEDRVRAALAKPVVLDGATVVPEGAVLVGSVLEANESGRVKGLASVAFRFTTLQVRDEMYTLSTARIARRAQATKGKDAEKVGIGAGAGALIGAVAGGGKGAAIGGAIGAGAGSGVVLATRGNEVRLGPGAAVDVVLDDPVTIMVPVD